MPEQRKTRPHHPRLDQTGSDHTRPGQTRLPQTKPDQAHPFQTRPARDCSLSPVWSDLVYVCCDLVWSSLVRRGLFCPGPVWSRIPILTIASQAAPYHTILDHTRLEKTRRDQSIQVETEKDETTTVRFVQDRREFATPNLAKSRKISPNDDECRRIVPYHVAPVESSQILRNLAKARQIFSNHAKYCKISPNVAVSWRNLVGRCRIFYFYLVFPIHMNMAKSGRIAPNLAKFLQYIGRYYYKSLIALILISRIINRNLAIILGHRASPMISVSNKLRSYL